MDGLSRSMMVLTCGLVVSVACGGSKGNPTTPPPPGPGPATVTSVSVAGNNSVTAGQTVQFAATANFSDSTTQNVSTTATWASTNNAAATVSGTGLATGVAAGNAEIRATVQGITGSAPLTVSAAPPGGGPTAQFAVSGPGGNNTCRIIKGSGGDLDCTFNGAASTGGAGGAVTAWIWRYDVGTNSAGPITENDPTHTPINLCGFLANKPNEQGSTGAVQMIVKLQVRNAAGVTSAELRNSNVSLFPQQECGFGF